MNGKLRWELTSDLLRTPWLSGGEADRFAVRFAEVRKTMRGGQDAVLAAEENPVDFLAVVFAALLADRAVILGNRGWGAEEWRQALEVRDRGLSPGEILIATGGSGGRLRFARHTWRTLAESANGFARFFDGGGIQSVCVLPLFHVSGFLQVIRALVSGGRVELHSWERMVAGELPELRNGFLSLVPTQLRRLLKGKTHVSWLRNLAAIPLGGAAPSAELLEEAANLELPVVLSYGATETGAMVTAQHPGDFLGGDRTSGRVLPHATVRIVDAGGKEVPAGTKGRIRVSGASIFCGYEPGIAHPSGAEWVSGDLGLSDDRGRLIVTGREDRVIISGGENISPEEVEAVLLASGRVEDVSVFGVSDSEWGETVVAAYVPVKGTGPEVLESWVKRELAAYKRPKLWVPLDELPRNAQGKIDRRELAERCQRRK